MGVFFEPNLTIAEGGGLTSKIVPYRLTGAGIAAGFGVGAAASFGKEIFAHSNRLKMGPVTYAGGPARMTRNVTSGAVEAIKEATNDPTVQADMLRKMIKTDEFVGSLEEYGVDGEFISAFYGMR